MLVNGVRYQLNNQSPLHRNRITFIQVGNPLIFASTDVASIARGSITLQAAMNMPAASRIIAPVAPIPVSETESSIHVNFDYS